PPPPTSLSLRYSLCTQGRRSSNSRGHELDPLSWPLGRRRVTSPRGKSSSSRPTTDSPHPVCSPADVDPRVPQPRDARAPISRTARRWHREEAELSVVAVAVEIEPASYRRRVIHLDQVELDGVWALFLYVATVLIDDYVLAV